MLGSEGGYALELEFLSRCADRISYGEYARVEDADYISCIGFVDYLPLLSHDLLGLREAHLLVALNVQHVHFLIELARAHTHEGYPVAVSLVHIGLYLENECRKAGVEGVYHSGGGKPCKRRRRHLQEVLKEGLNAEIRQSRTEEHGGKSSLVDSLEVEFLGSAVQQLNILAESVVQILSDKLTQRRVGYIRNSGGDLVLAENSPVVEGEGDELSVAAVINAFEILSAANRPVHGIGGYAQLVFDLVQQIEGVSALSVHLVDECENGDMPHRADLEELSRLVLDAL